jgi:hypothetical protein
MMIFWDRLGVMEQMDLTYGRLRGAGTSDPGTGRGVPRADFRCLLRPHPLLGSTGCLSVGISHTDGWGRIAWLPRRVHLGVHLVMKFARSTLLFKVVDGLRQRTTFFKGDLSVLKKID